MKSSKRWFILFSVINGENGLDIKQEVYNIFKKFGFLILQDGVVYIESNDATTVFKAISLGLNKSPIKQFIDDLQVINGTLSNSYELLDDVYINKKELI